MKIFLFSMLSISIIVLSLPACNPETEQPTGQVTTLDNVGEEEPGEKKAVGIVDRPDARELVKKYRDNYGNVHTKAVWFKREFIKLLYDSLYSDSLHSTPTRFDGVRVYFGVYPPGFTTNRALDNQLTIFFVPTHQVTYNNHPMSKDTFIYKKEKFFNLNHGELCPNNCDSLDELHLGH